MKISDRLSRWSRCLAARAHEHPLEDYRRTKVPDRRQGTRDTARAVQKSPVQFGVRCGTVGLGFCFKGNRMGTRCRTCQIGAAVMASRAGHMTEYCPLLRGDVVKTSHFAKPAVMRRQRCKGIAVAGVTNSKILAHAFNDSR